MIRSWIAIMTAVLVFAPLLVAQAPSADKGAKTIEGKLTKEDAKDRVRAGRFHKVHTMELQKGGAYQIDLKSRQFDPYLRLEDADNKQLASDDDGGGFPNSRLVFSPKKSGKYRIIVTTFGAGETGSYSLTVVKASGAVAELQKLQSEYNATQQKLFTRYQKATDKEKQQILKQFRSLGSQFGPKALKLAEAHPNDPVASQAMSWLFGRLQFGEALMTQYETAVTNKGKNAAKIKTQNIALLERVAKNFPAQKRSAQDALFLLKNLSVGCQAPEIEAEDIDGVKFKLSDYRGKVVVLDFWGDW